MTDPFQCSIMNSTVNDTWDEDASDLLQDEYDDGWVWDDATWILCSSFIIFTMQTGFGMLESGCVSLKNEVNIMMKNVVDVVLGGITYWAFGYGFSYGSGPGTNPFFGFGDWFLNAEGKAIGPVFTTFLFQLSFATTATTIVSGGIAERCNFYAYCLFSLVNTVVYCFPAGWLWGQHGFLKNLGAVDIAGSGGVHLVGGSSAFVAASIMGPRLGRWDISGDPPMGSPTNACIGLFMLWWGWMAFNAGSTFGISGRKWILAAKATCTTMVSSFAGGIFSIFHSLYVTNGKLDILMLINGILGALVGVTGGCAIVTPREAVFIGIIGSFLANITAPLLIWLKIDDAVGATCVHGFGGMWGMLAVGLFAEKDELEGFSQYAGLFHGGGFYLLGVQTLCCVCFIAWSSLLTYVLIKSIDKVIHFRMTEIEELVGADYCEHNILHPGVGVTRAVSVIKRFDKSVDLGLIPVGKNKGHMEFLEREYAARLETAVHRHAMTSTRHRRTNKVDHISFDTTKC
ncbi:putative ammonium transporter 3 [Tigriopus californicus]|uniref:putative ammonium transporter 3 n=1 Tax=Tigriopus californicus TaxID=6832 RepID=UPI0027DA4699|nr:putative ammonium transporter 3 [Tigriopus californicus]